MTWLNKIVDWILERSIAECDGDETIVRQTLVTAWVVVSAFTPGWGATYLAYGELGGLIPMVYGLTTYGCFVALHRFGGFEWLRVLQLVQHLLLPFILMWTLGGFGPSSAVLIWAMLAPLSSVWAGRSTEAWWVTAGFLGLTLLSALIDTGLRGTNDLPVWLRTAFYGGNFIVMTGVTMGLVGYYAWRQRGLLEVMRRNRELEAAYLSQEISLRQSDKLATIGKLTAGLAHELNNPAAAAQQATHALAAILNGDERIRSEVAALELEPAEAAVLMGFAERIVERVGHPDFMDPLERSDREGVVQEMLDEAGVEDGWEIAPALVALGIDGRQVTELAAEISPTRVGDALRLLAGEYDRHTLIRSLNESTGRIIDMVGALKSYTHLDRAPSQQVNIHDGLESTLVMFQNRLKGDISVTRDYDTSIPEINAFGGELNQVWTNILDNAIDAMGGSGAIALSTRRSGDEVVVEIADTGPGIPSELVESVFDPFVTTKEPGVGTGLGLNISHSIITQKHAGGISVASRPGRTVFTIRLPITRPESPACDD